MTGLCLSCIVLISLGMVCNLISGLTYVAMIGEVNGSKNQSEKYSIWGNDVLKVVRIFSEHERLYASSGYRTRSVGFFAVGVLLNLAGIVALLFQTVSG